MLEWLDLLVATMRGLLDSPWLWLVVFVVAGLDALLPFMPSEGAVVTVAVLLGPDPAGLALLVLVAAGGALAGDVGGHGLGRLAGSRTLDRVLRGERSRRSYEWAKTTVHRHGTALVVAGRYVPGGRVAVGLATGSLRFPLRRFVAFDALGTTIWAVYAVALGYLGGAGFSDDPALGLLVSLGAGIAALGVAELVRRVLARRRAPAGPTGPTATVTSDNGEPCTNVSTSSPSAAPTAGGSSPASPPSSPRSVGGSSRPPTTPTRIRDGSSPARR
ncbi:DedA family protein [Saccharomonospora piscinae]|uniref:DedA family protein n=1 Tax=Saccharomonospora piscinae TaxID=687388 RepID=UPI000463C8B3|nr:DedA family protein [Saccharomonospora piscinae]